MPAFSFPLARVTRMGLNGRRGAATDPTVPLVRNGFTRIPKRPCEDTLW
jgi:hypothetical protein